MESELTDSKESKTKKKNHTVTFNEKQENSGIDSQAELLCLEVEKESLLFKSLQNSGIIFKWLENTGILDEEKEPDIKKLIEDTRKLKKKIQPLNEEILQETKAIEELNEEIKQKASILKTIKKKTFRQTALKLEVLKLEALENQQDLKLEAFKLEQKVIKRKTLKLEQKALKRKARKLEALKQEARKLEQEALKQEALKLEVLKLEALNPKDLKQEALKLKARKQKALKLIDIKQKPLKNLKNDRDYELKNLKPFIESLKILSNEIKKLKMSREQIYEKRCRCKEVMEIKEKLTEEKIQKRLEKKPYKGKLRLYPSVLTDTTESKTKTFQIKYERKLSPIAKLVLTSFQAKYFYYAIDDILYLFKSNSVERENLLAILYSPVLSLHNNFSINFFNIWIQEIYIDEVSKVNKFLTNNSSNLNLEDYSYITIKLLYRINESPKNQQSLW